MDHNHSFPGHCGSLIIYIIVRIRAGGLYVKEYLLSPFFRITSNRIHFDGPLGHFLGQDCASSSFFFLNTSYFSA